MEFFNTVRSCILSLLYGFLVSLSIVVAILRHGFKYFHVNSREKPCRILDDLGQDEFYYSKTTRLHFRFDGKASNPMIIFLHGFPEFWFSWRHQIRYFRKKYFVVALDLRGHGESEAAEDMQCYKMSFLLEDVLMLFNVFKNTPAVLVGHDWGGIIAWNFTALFPNLVTKLIILNSPHPDIFQKYMWDYSLRFWYFYYFQLPYLPEITLSSNDLIVFNNIFQKELNPPCEDDEVEAYKYYYSKTNSFREPLNYFRANFENGRVQFNDIPLSKINVPTLVIWGGKEPRYPRSLLYYSVETVFNVTCLILEDCAHFAHIQMPYKVNAFIEKYLDETSLG